MEIRAGAMRRGYTHLFLRRSVICPAGGTGDRHFPAVAVVKTDAPYRIDRGMDVVVAICLKRRAVQDVPRRDRVDHVHAVVAVRSGV